MGKIEVGDWYEVITKENFYFGMVGMVEEAHPKATKLWFGSNVGSIMFYNYEVSKVNL